jgi:integrase
MRQKLTKRTIEACQPAAKDYFVWDTELIGFGCKVTPAGKKALVLQYRLPGVGRAGTARRIMLGRFGSITVEHARNLALRALAQVAEGQDPAQERREAHVAAATTLTAVAEQFIERHGRNLRPRTRAELRRLIEKEVLPTLGPRPIAEIRRRDLIALHDTISDRGHVPMANKVAARLKALFAWAVEREYVEHSPAVGLRLTRETPRQRVLTDDELRAIWRAAASVSYPYGPFIQLLMLTAARRNEVAEMEWRELSNDMTVWTLSRERSKTAAGRTILLSEGVTAILRELSRVGDRWVLTFDGRRPIAAFGNAKVMVDKLSGVAGWTFHDFRRSLSTWLARADFEPHIAEAVLGHTPVKGIAAVYNVHRYEQACQRALEAWSAHIRGVSPAGNVTRIASQRLLGEQVL